MVRPSSARGAVPVESRSTRTDRHGQPAPVNRDDDDGDLVSDGIVTWRRKLPDLNEFGRTASTVDHHQHHHHYRHGGGRHAVADSRKMSTPAAAADWASTRPAASGRRDRRDAFAQQKSFSYEAAACVGRRLPPTPNELAAAARLRHGGGGGGDLHGGGGTAAVSATAHPVDRRRRMLMEAKKSYSLDDQIAPSHLAASEVRAYDPSPPRDSTRLQVDRDTVRSATREPAVSGERSPSG